MVKKLLLLLLWVFMLHCNSNPQQAENNQATAVKTDVKQSEEQPAGNPQYLNNITVQQEGGLVISHASLVDEGGKLIGPTNTIQANDTWYLQLGIRKGWIIQNGTVSLGAVQTITTNLGEQVLQTGDLFANEPVIAKEKAGTIRLQSVITKTRPDISYYNIRFRIWDKRGKAEATGEYQIRLSQ